ncbi:rhodanese-like domain-containing protein [Natrinema gelatinilyticum]|uniref:rhodanese-like domain-containing protein n=1 Tax=Natrinema gelatinilyticum TaxID=2961571 RepID=UPI0020C486F2|nr:rhodanese-like domain-containing protein [Natrinema gelatinilyticum]
MKRIRPDELEARLESNSRDDLFLLDIRPEPAFRADSIERSYNIPVYDDLRRGDDAELRDRLDEIPPENDVVVVCKMGVVAKRATSVLEEEGYDAATLAGGMSGWTGYRTGSLGYRLRSVVWSLRESMQAVS